MSTLRRALRFFRSDAPRLVLVFLLLVLGAVASVLKPWPLAVIVDSLLGGAALPHWLGPYDPATSRNYLLAVLVGLVLVLHAGQGILAATQNFIAIQIGLRGLRRVRNEVFQWLQRLSLRFHRSAQAGDLIQRAVWDTYAFQTLFQQGVVTAATAGLSLLLMLGVMLSLSVWMTLAALAVVPLLLLSIRYFGRGMQARGAEAQQADSQVTSLVQQSIVTLPLVQSYAREAREKRIFLAHTSRAQKRRLSQHGWELLYWLGVSLSFAVGTALMVWLGSVLVLSHQLTLGRLLVFLAYLAQLYEPLNQLSHVGATIATASAAADRVFEILDTPEEVQDDPLARPVVGARTRQRPRLGVALSGGRLQVGYQGKSVEPPAGALAPAPLYCDGRIGFENVSFGYSPERPVLHEVTFSLAPGQRVALIGPSGAGKTTLMNLLPRFFDPAAGMIRLDGVDLRKLRLHDLRHQIAVVLQEPILVAASVADNIAYGKPGASLEEIEAAARAANAHAFIEQLPQKYETMIGEGGATLSVGERQRLNLARAFLKDATLLLLDEPTSALDAESEQAVLRSVLELMGGRTTLMIAHRLATVQQMDKVMVLEAGRVTEFGSPAELAAQNGYFARVMRGEAKLE